MEPRTDGAMAATFGFLTAVDSPTHGIFGGYLVVDPLGRPLEFHCTAPVQVSRAQRILYGPTLEEHLWGRQIGGTLIEAAAGEPAVVLVDLPALRHVRRHTARPVVLVGPPTTDTAREPPAAAAAGMAFGGARVTALGDPAAVRGCLEELALAVDLCEPFERIRLAIEEAQRS